LAVVLAALFGGCATVDEPAPSPRRKARAATAADRPPAVPEVDRVLVDYRSGVSALRRGDDAEAKAKFDDAIARIGGIIANDEQAARARGLFSAEREKPFIGEPYRAA
jgi:hypothetical protein